MKPANQMKLAVGILSAMTLATAIGYAWANGTTMYEKCVLVTLVSVATLLQLSFSQAVFKHSGSDRKVLAAIAAILTVLSVMTCYGWFTLIGQQSSNQAAVLDTHHERTTQLFDLLTQQAKNEQSTSEAQLRISHKSDSADSNTQASTTLSDIKDTLIQLGELETRQASHNLTVLTQLPVVALLALLPDALRLCALWYLSILVREKKVDISSKNDNQATSDDTQSFKNPPIVQNEEEPEEIPEVSDETLSNDLKDAWETLKDGESVSISKIRTRMKWGYPRASRAFKGIKDQLEELDGKLIKPANPAN